MIWLALAMLIPVGDAPCAPTALINRDLVKMFHMQRVFTGMGDSGAVYDVWVNPQTGKWNIMISSPAGITCYIDGGELSRVFGVGEPM